MKKVFITSGSGFLTTWPNVIPCLSSAFLVHDRNFQFISSVHSLYLLCILLRNDRIKEVMMKKKTNQKNLIDGVIEKHCKTFNRACDLSGN